MARQYRFKPVKSHPYQPYTPIRLNYGGGKSRRQAAPARQLPSAPVGYSPTLWVNPLILVLLDRLHSLGDPAARRAARERFKPRRASWPGPDQNQNE